MESLLNAYESIRDFLESGGDVVMLIMCLIFFMWLLIFERILYFNFGHRRLVKQVTDIWEARSERKSWEAHRIREKLVSHVSIGINASMPMIATMVALCPLMGLLGTVTGMIDVFEVMALLGSGNARAMAGGVSKATIPTMAGMVGAISGIFAYTFLERYVRRQKFLVEDRLTMDH
ncbi:MAG: MotA/TolQ/ExbB proton channel family protein [Pseudomonadota bacterium]